MLLKRKLLASLSAAAMLAAMMLFAPAALAQTSEGSASASATASLSGQLDRSRYYFRCVLCATERYCHC